MKTPFKLEEETKQESTYQVKKTKQKKFIPLIINFY